MSGRRAPSEAPGAARERTALSWSRSTLALGTIAGSLVRASAQDGQLAAGLIVGGLILLAAAALAAAVRGPYREPRASGPLGGVAALRLLTGVTVGTGTLAFALVVLA